jgi:DNA-binding XRE family transcriptional regulator
MAQAKLADNVGVSRQTVVTIETRKRPMPWTLYLTMMFVFRQNEESKKLIESFELLDDILIDSI